MYSFRINYSEGHHKTYSNIEKAHYRQAMQDIVISGEELFTHAFPLGCDLHLFTKENHYIISHQGVAQIIVSKQAS